MANKPVSGNLWERYADLEAKTRTEASAIKAGAIALDQAFRDTSGKIADRLLGVSGKDSQLRTMWPLTNPHVKELVLHVAQFAMGDFEQPKLDPDATPSSFDSTKFYDEDLEAVYGDDNPRARCISDLITWADELAEDCPVLFLVDMGEPNRVEVKVYPHTPELEAYLTGWLSSEDPTIRFGNGFLTHYDAETEAFLQAGRPA